MLDINGAVEAEWPDEGVAAHYGDPAREQRAMTEGAASPGGRPPQTPPGKGGQVLVDRSNRGVVKVTGPDRLSWLHSLTSQDVQRLAPGSTKEALILSPQGHLEHATVGAVNEDLAFRHRALLARRVAVVGGDALVRPLCLDGPIDVKHCPCSYNRCSARRRSGARRWSRTRAVHRAPG